MKRCSGTYRAANSVRQFSSYSTYCTVKFKPHGTKAPFLQHFGSAVIE
jgi:hypothetical protein